MSVCTTPPAQFNPAQWLKLEQTLNALDPAQTRSLLDYLNEKVNGESAIKGRVNATKVMLCHGGETGNSESLAKQLATQFCAAGIAAEVQDLAQLRLRQLARQEYVIVICSTHGDGDPPEPITEFYEALLSELAPALPTLQFAVLALGDSSYEKFCLTGIEIDQRLEALGANRLLPRTDCDVDFEHTAQQWSDSLIALLASKIEPLTTQAPDISASTNTIKYSKQKPLVVEVLDNIRLSALTRVSANYHIELALELDDFPIMPGDALGVLPDNCPQLVAKILDSTQLSGDAPVTIKEVAMPLAQTLREHLDLTVPSARFLEYWAQCSASVALQNICANPSQTLRAFLKEQQIGDLLSQYPGRPDPQSFVDSLRPLQPRLYDVANSLNVVSDELHLLVKEYHYKFKDRLETGVASRQLANLQPGETIRIYPHKNARFHLPERADAPLILIGDGTGIAPYRAFLQALSTRANKPIVWLLFAEQQFEEDFLYQIDIQKAYDAGSLSFVDTVFYTDAAERSLADAVRDRVSLFYDLLRDSAHLYFCGDKARLQACEKSLEQTCIESATDTAHSALWDALIREKRIHRNLY